MYKIQVAGAPGLRLSNGNAAGGSVTGLALRNRALRKVNALRTLMRSSKKRYKIDTGTMNEKKANHQGPIMQGTDFRSMTLKLILRKPGSSVFCHESMCVSRLRFAA